MCIRDRVLTNKKITSFQGNGDVEITTPSTAGTLALKTDIPSGIPLSKMENISTNRIIGRVTENPGIPEVLTPTQVRGILNVSDGADVNVATNLALTNDEFGFKVTSSTGDDVTLPPATTTVNGIMSTDMVTKLNGIEEGADVNVATNLALTNDEFGFKVTSSTGDDVTLPPATTTVNGIMSTGTVSYTHLTLPTIYSV